MQILRYITWALAALGVAGLLYFIITYIISIL